MDESRSKIGAARRGERGFTLPEIMITIVIAGIILAIASSSWFGLVESRAVDSAANQVASDMRLAHTSATNQLASWQLVYRADGSSVTCNGVTADYCLIKVNGATVSERIPRSLPDNTRILNSNLTNVVVPLLGYGYDRAVQFNASGSAEAIGGLPLGVTAPRLVVSPEGKTNPSHVIEVIPATSRVRVDP